MSLLYPRPQKKLGGCFIAIPAIPHKTNVRCEVKSYLISPCRCRSHFSLQLGKTSLPNTCMAWAIAVSDSASGGRSLLLGRIHEVSKIRKITEFVTCGSMFFHVYCLSCTIMCNLNDPRSCKENTPYKKRLSQCCVWCLCRIILVVRTLQVVNR